jgi:hypothetical protein
VFSKNKLNLLWTQNNKTKKSNNVKSDFYKKITKKWSLMTVFRRAYIFRQENNKLSLIWREREKNERKKLTEKLYLIEFVGGRSKIFSISFRFSFAIAPLKHATHSLHFTNHRQKHNQSKWVFQMKIFIISNIQKMYRKQKSFLFCILHRLKPLFIWY